jgi:hypothetical protein
MEATDTRLMNKLKLLRKEEGWEINPFQYLTADEDIEDYVDEVMCFECKDESWRALNKAILFYLRDWSNPEYRNLYGLAGTLEQLRPSTPNNDKYPNWLENVFFGIEYGRWWLPSNPEDEAHSTFRLEQCVLVRQDFESPYVRYMRKKYGMAFMADEPRYVIDDDFSIVAFTPDEDKVVYWYERYKALKVIWEGGER